MAIFCEIQFKSNVHIYRSIERSSIYIRISNKERNQLIYKLFLCLWLCVCSHQRVKQTEIKLIKSARRLVICAPTLSSFALSWHLMSEYRWTRSFIALTNKGGGWADISLEHCQLAGDTAFKAKDGQQQKLERRQPPCQHGRPLQAWPQLFKCEGVFLRA